MAANPTDATNGRGFSLRVPRREAMLIAGALLLGGGGTMGGLNLLGSAKAETPALTQAIDLADLKAEIAGMHADIRALLQSQQELREDVRELRRRVR